MNVCSNFPLNEEMNVSSNFPLSSHRNGTSAVLGATLYLTQSLYTVAGFTCAMGNLLVIIVIIRNKKLHGKIFLFLVSLALGDVFKGLGYLSAGTKRLHLLNVGGLHPGSVTSFDCMQEFATTMLILGPQSINLMTILVSLDRFLAVAFPLFYYKHLTKKYAYVCISICWILVIISYSMAWTGSSLLPRTPKYSKWCVASWSFSGRYNKFMFGFEAVSTWVSFIFLLGTFLAIRCPRTANIASIERPSYYKRQVYLTKMVLISLSMVVILWMFPTNIVFGMTLIGRTDTFDVHLAPILWLMVAFSGCTNVIVYAWLNKKIKAGIKELFFNCGQRQCPSQRNKRNALLEMGQFSSKIATHSSRKSSSNYRSL